MIRRIVLTVTCAAAPLQLEGAIDVDDGFGFIEEEDKTALRRVFVYYKERSDRWAVAFSMKSVEDAARMDRDWHSEPDQLNETLAVYRILGMLEEWDMAVDA